MEKNGGRPKNKTIGFEKNKTIGFQKEETKTKPNVNENENVNVNDNVNVNALALYDADVEKINNLFIEALGSTNTNNIQECISYLDKLPFEVIEHALKKTARNGAKWSYAMSILDSYIEKNINTIEKVKADEIEFKSKTKIDKKEETLEEQIERYKREWGLEDED